MAQIVTLPNGNTVEFPDDMSADAMSAAISSSFPDLAPKAQSTSILDRMRSALGKNPDATADKPAGIDYRPGVSKALDQAMPPQVEVSDAERGAAVDRYGFAVASQAQRGIDDQNAAAREAQPATALKVPETSDGVWEGVKGLAKGNVTDLGKQGGALFRLVGQWVSGEAVGNPELQQVGQNIDEAGKYLFDKYSRREQREQPQYDSMLGRGVYSGLRSLEQMAASIMIAGPRGALGYMTAGQVGLPAAGEAMDKGLGTGESIGYAAGQAGIEYVTEKLPMGYILDKFGKEGVKRFVQGFLARELPGELVATATQNALEQAVLHPEKSWAEYRRELPDQLAETGVAVATMGGALGGLHAGAKSLDNFQAAARADRAKQNAMSTWSGGFAGRQNPAARPSANPADILNAPDLDSAIAAADKMVSAPVDMPGIDDIEGVAMPQQATLPVTSGGVPGPFSGRGAEAVNRDMAYDMAQEQRDAELRNEREREFALAEQARRDMDFLRAEETARDQLVEQAQALTRAQGFDDAVPNAMQLALRRALEKRVEAAAPNPVQPSIQSSAVPIQAAPPENFAAAPGVQTVTAPPQGDASSSTNDLLASGGISRSAAVNDSLTDQPVDSGSAVTPEKVGAGETVKSVERIRGKLAITGFTADEIREAAGKLRVDVRVGQDGNALVSIIGRSGNAGIFTKPQEKALRDALLGKDIRQTNRRKITGNLRNDLNALHPGLYAEVERGGDGEATGRFDLGAIAEELRDEYGYAQIPQGDAKDAGEALIDMIRQGGAVNEDRMLAGRQAEEARKERDEIDRLASEYGVDTHKGIVRRKQQDVAAELMAAIEHEIGVSGNGAAAAREAASSAGMTEAEISAIEDRIADEYFGDPAKDAMVQMYRAITNELQGAIDARIGLEEGGQDGARPGEGARAGAAARGAREERPDFALERQTEAELSAKAARENDQALADRETADQQREAFALSAPEGSAAPKAAPSQQAGLFTATGQASHSATQTPADAGVSVSGADFVTAPDGSIDFGEITAVQAKAMRRQAGKIRLEQGNSNYGLQHIEERHGAQIRSIGFASVESFVADAVRHVDAIWKPAKTTQLVMLQSIERGKAVFIELKPASDGDYYTVNTAFPVSDGYAENKKGWSLLWGGASVPAVASGANPLAGAAPDAGEPPAMTPGQSSNSSVAERAAEGNASEKTVAEMSPADLLRAAADKMDAEKKASENVGADKAVDQSPEREQDPGATMFSRSEGQGERIHPEDLSAVVKRARQAFPGIQINMLDDESQAPKSLRDQIEEADAVGEVAGAYHDGELYVIRSGIRDIEHAEHTVVHEAEHGGLRRQFGEDRHPVMLDINKSNLKVRAKAFELSKRFGYSAVRSTEEVLADMGPEVKKLKGWDRLVAWVRDKLRRFGFVKDWTDNDVEALVLRALEAVKKPAGTHITRGTAFSRGAGQQSLGLAEGKAMSPDWGIGESSPWADFVYKYQDKYVDLKDLIQAITNAGQAVRDAFDPYLQEELYHKRVGKRTSDFFENEFKPLLVQMRMNKVSQEEFEEYLLARHAREANALIRDRGGMEDGGSGMTDAEADDYFSGLDADRRSQYEAMAKRVDAMIAGTRQTLADYGLESRDTLDGWAKMFEHYVPLYREDMDEGQGVGQGFSVRGPAAKHRTGSSRRVADILANIAQQRDRAIVRGEKNRVAVALYGLAYTNPNPDVWEVDRAPQKQTLDRNGMIVDAVDPLYKSRPNVVVARIKGSGGEVHDRAVVFNDRNERAVRLAEALKNLDAPHLEGVIGISAKITRYIAAMSTQYNPVFVAVNFARDFQSVALNLSSTPLAGRQAEVAGHALSALRGIFADLRDHRAGKTPASKWAALYEEMQLEGGTTGYRDMFANAKERTAEQVEKLLDPEWWTKTGWGKLLTAGGVLRAPEQWLASKPGAALMNWLSDLNETAENAMRLAVYKTALDHGMTKARAASLAKNISVNFNRKGQVGAQMNALYAFFNAAVQGTARLAETMRGPAGRQIVAGGILLGVMQALMMAAAGFGDDDPPDFVRERSLIIPLGDKRYLTIPMPLGFHVLSNIGRIPAELVMRGFRDPGKAVANLIGVFAEAFNPIGSAGVSLQTLMPTPLDPLAALAENRDWTGKTIYREDFNKLRPTPGFTRAKDTASGFGKWVADVLNKVSGGTDYTPGWASPTPDQIDYLVGQATGGVGREALKAWQAGESVLTGEELPAHKRPLIGRFYGKAEGQAHEGGRFYENLKRINLHRQEIEGRRRDGLDVSEYLAYNPEARLSEAARQVERQIGFLRRQKRKMLDRDAGRDEVRRQEERITGVMKRFNDRVKAVEEGGG